MTITAKQIERSNVVCSFKNGSIFLPEPAQIFSLYNAEASKGSIFSDNLATSTRVFEFPSVGFMWIFEPNRIRLEDKKHRTPDESKLAHEFMRVVTKLYPQAVLEAYGFNYDIVYRMSSVIPVSDVMRSFLAPEVVESVKSFGWQYTLAKQKSKRVETYFFKVISPIEYGVHVNHHFNDRELPKEEYFQKAFENCYVDADEGVGHINFQ